MAVPGRRGDPNGSTQLSGEQDTSGDGTSSHFVISIFINCEIIRGKNSQQGHPGASPHPLGRCSVPRFLVPSLRTRSHLSSLPAPRLVLLHNPEAPSEPGNVQHRPTVSAVFLPRGVTMDRGGVLWKGAPPRGAEAPTPAIASLWVSFPVTSHTRTGLSQPHCSRCL